MRRVSSSKPQDAQAAHYTAYFTQHKLIFEHRGRKED